MRKALVFLFLFSLTILSAKETYFVVYNKDFFNIFPEKQQIYNTVKSKVSGYNLYEVKLKNYSALTSEFENLLNLIPNGVIFVDDFIAPLLLKNEKIFSQKKFKLVSYNLPENYSFNLPLPVFNITLNNKYLYQEIDKTFRKYSKKKNYSDCGIVYNSNSLVSLNSIAYLRSTGKEVQSQNTFNNENNLKNWVLSNSKLEVIVLFGQDSNIFINQVDEDKKRNVKFVEVFTNLAESKSFIKKRIDINWKKVIDYALNSKQYKQFLKSKDLPYKFNNLIVDKNFLIIKNF